MQPAASLLLGAEHHFTESLSSFTFTSSEPLLKSQLHSQPLTLEVWMSGDNADSLVGAGKVTFTFRCSMWGKFINSILRASPPKEIKPDIIAPLHSFCIGSTW